MLNHNKILEKLNEKYLKLLHVELYKNKFIDLSLPLFLDNGSCVEITLYIEGDKIIFENSMHQNVEEHIAGYTSSHNIKKDYFLNSERFKAVISSVLEENAIEHSLIQRKKIDYKDYENNYEDLAMEILTYVFNISRYYNYIINYTIANAKEENQVKALKSAIKKYVYNFNESNNKNKINKIENDEVVYSNNDYYFLEKTIVSGIGTKLSLHQVIDDIEDLVDSKENQLKKAIVFVEISKSKKNGLKSYIENKTKKSKGLHNVIEFKLIENFEEIEQEFNIIRDSYGI